MKENTLKYKIGIGLIPKKSPRAIPPKDVCATPSLIIDSFRNITNNPISEQVKAAIVPPKIAN